jgi:hypothetical protein
MGRGRTAMKGALTRRVEELEEQATPAGRVRVCWIGNEPDDLQPSDTLYRMCWLDDDEDEQ